MYIVQWNDREGNLRTRRFERMEDARMEAEYLRGHYDGVEIIDEETGEPVELQKSPAGHPLGGRHRGETM